MRKAAKVALLFMAGCSLFPKPSYEPQNIWKQNKELIEVCVWYGSKKFCSLVDRREIERKLNLYY